MRFVPIKAGVLLAMNLAALNPKENTLDEVILKNYEAHKDGSPETVLNVSEPVADRILELGPAPVPVSTETLKPADLAAVVQPVVAPVVPVVETLTPVVPVVETVSSVAATNIGPIVEPGPTVPSVESTATATSESSSSEVSPAPEPEAKTEEKPKAKK